jgi:hypothetical protein
MSSEEGTRMKTVAEYRKFAKDWRQLAATLGKPEDKRALLLMATAWEKGRQRARNST